MLCFPFLCCINIPTFKVEFEITSQNIKRNIYLSIMKTIKQKCNRLRKMIFL
jgi:hypothetical protein